MKRFEDKTVIVTGAASGIGRACVERLLREGARVVAADLRQEQVDALGTLAPDRTRLHCMAVNVSRKPEVEKLVADTVSRFGVPDGLVNSAGIRGVGTVLDFDEEAWHRVLSVNLDGTFYACQAFARALQQAKRPGAIVNVSSGAGIMGVPNRLGYVASKFGVSGITRTMSAELGPLGVRVNAVAPGMIRTPMTEVMFQDPENVRRIRAAHAVGREGQPEEVAAAIVFLLTEDASFISGAVIPVDGGNTACIPSH